MKYTIEDCKKMDNNIVCYIPNQEVYNILKSVFSNMTDWHQDYKYYLLSRPGHAKTKEVYHNSVMFFKEYNIINHFQIIGIGSHTGSKLVFNFIR